MAGRWIRKWSISGCLIVGAMGCNRNAVQQTETQPVSGMPMTSAANKSMWGNSKPQPAEVVTEAPKKGPVRPETEVAIADVRLTTALDEKTPDVNRAAILDMARLGYQKALQQDPKNKAAILGLARYYSRVGDREKTVEWYQKYLTNNPADRDVMHEIAFVFARWRDWTTAVAWCDRALQADPENMSVRKTKAFCLARGGRWEESFAVFLTIMPEAQARYNIARALEHQNYTDASKQQLQLALQADPNFSDARDFLAELDPSTRPAGVADPNTIQRAGFTSP